jgi:hypothetical protein
MLVFLAYFFFSWANLCVLAFCRCFGKKKVEPEVKGDGAPAPAAVAAEEGAKPAAAPVAGGESH